MSFIPTDYSQIQKQIKSQKESSYWGGYYQPGVFGGTPSKNKMFSGRILPAFNYQLSMADSEFAKSWAPYRNNDNVDTETNQPVLNAFFAVVAAYSWFGNKQVSFLSPSTRRYTQSIMRGPEIIDPVQDIRNYAKKHDDPAIRALTERQENKKDAKVIIPYPQRRYVFNFYGTAGADRNIRNMLIDVSQKAFEDFAAKLSEWRPAHEQVLDQNWPNYLYGDVTDPQTGLMIDTVSIPATPQPFNGFAFTSGSHKSLKGIRQYPVPEEALVNRYHLYGDTSVFKIMSAQEIVDFLVEDGAIPYHLIQEVCGNYTNVPPQPSGAKVFPGSHDEEEEHGFVPPVPVPMPTQASPRPVAPPPPPPAQAAPPPPPPPPPAVESEYWVMLDGVVQGECTYKASDVQDIVNKNPQNKFMVCDSKSGVWQGLSEAGFTQPKASPPPPPPPPQAAPPPPPALPSVAPAVAQTTAPTAEGLTPEEMAEFQDLKSKFDSDNISMPEMTRFVKLSTKMNK